jgi:MFS family permease
VSSKTNAEEARDRSIIRSIYAIVLLVGIGYGLSTAVVSLFLRRLGFAEHHVGYLGSAFASGIVAGSLVAGKLIERLSAKRTLLLGLLGYALAVSAFPLGRAPTFFALSRAIDGAFSVLVWVSVETELLRRASSTNKARVMSLYAISLALGYVVGPVIARGLMALSLPLGAVFVSAGLLAALAFVLALLRFPRAQARELVSGAIRSLAPKSQSAFSILRQIRTSCFATFAYGYFQISVVTLLPLYLIAKKGILEEQTVMITAIFAVGMLGFSQVAGKLADLHGHIRVMRVLAAIGLVMVASFAWLRAFSLMAVAVLIAGATLASISPVSLAFQGAVVAPSELHRANAFYNSFYALGMLLGPAVSGAIFHKAGGGVMLLHLAGLWGLFVVSTFWFSADDTRFFS